MTPSSAASERTSLIANKLKTFEAITRRANLFTEAAGSDRDAAHPFDSRNIHPDLPSATRKLFDNGHFSQSTFEAYKFLDEEVQRISGEDDFGKSLMMRVMGGDSTRIRLTPGMTSTEKSEQEGYKFLFAGAMAAMRNPRGHSTHIVDDPDTCLDHLSFASLLLRRLEEAGLR